MSETTTLPRTHGCPADRGAADAYYGRGKQPHYWLNGTRVTAEQMTPEQIAEYHHGYDNEWDRKEWD